MLRLLLARHGQTEWNALRRNQGQADTPMDETGYRQARQLAAALAAEQIDAVYSSDLARCLETARPIAEAARIEPVADRRLQERDYGEWEGRTPDELEQEDPQALAAYRADPVLNGPTGGETGIDVFCRAGYFLTDLLKAHSEGVVVVVAHGGSIAALLAALLHGPPSTATCFRLQNCSVSEVVLEADGVRRFVRFNDISHLAPAPLDWSRVQPTCK
ncbi:MAG: histidine phosphatase family protein [Armatimonadetes bacterium]|nr:histidine phosphatase family protein [Armatimonadota bacterium]